MSPPEGPEMLMLIWRAKVGRLPRGHEPRFRDICARFPWPRVERAINTVAGASLRRTNIRWGVFLALFGEAP